MHSLPPPVLSSLPGPNVAPASVDASSWVTSWHGSRVVGDPEGLGDADAVGVGDGDAGADVAGAGGGSAVPDALVAGAGAVVAAAVAGADTFAGSVVTLVLLDDLHEVISNAQVGTTTMSAVRRRISGISGAVVLRGRSHR
jgi:hypothetical protein